MEEDIDTRWSSFLLHGFKCAGCDELHTGVFDLAYVRPDAWPGAVAYEANSSLKTDGNFLSEDFCVVEGAHFFVRGVLVLPIIGVNGATFGYGTWASLSRKNFEAYVTVFDSGHSGDDDWFGWFSNRLKGYPETFNLKCRVRTRPGRQRPVFLLEPTDHPLAIEQRKGVKFDRLLEIYASHGHEIELPRSSTN